MQVQYNGQYDCLPSSRRGFDSHHLLHMVAVVQLVRTPDCGSGGRQFESAQPPHRQTQQIYFLLKTLILGLRNVKVISVQFFMPQQLSWIEHPASTRSVGSSSLSWGANFYAGLAQLDRVTGYEPVGRGFKSLNPYQQDASPSVRIIAKCEYGDGPNRIGLGGHHATVEVARSVHLIFIKKYDIIYM